MARAVGIDLGTTYSLVASAEAGKHQVIPDDKGETRFPSAIFLGENGRDALGWEALQRAENENGQLLLSVKRFMGRPAQAARASMKLEGFELAEGDDRFVRF